MKNISEAKAELSVLVDAVIDGDEVLLIRAGVPVAKLVRYTCASARRVPGALKGQIVIHEDCYERPDDIAASGIEPQDACSRSTSFGGG